jgi:hypothetical protein
VKYVYHIMFLLHIANTKKWILGNTFPFVVFVSFGAFWLGYGATLQPFYNSVAAYKDPSDAESTGLESVGFNVGIGKSYPCTESSDVWSANAFTRLLYDMHGLALSHLPRLFHPHEPDLLPYLFHARSRIRSPRWRVPQCS